MQGKRRPMKGLFDGGNFSDTALTCTSPKKIGQVRLTARSFHVITAEHSLFHEPVECLLTLDSENKRFITKRRQVCVKVLGASGGAENV